MKTTKRKRLAVILIGLLLASCGGKKVVLNPDLYNLGPRTGKKDKILMESVNKCIIMEGNEMKIRKNRANFNDLVKLKQINKAVANKNYLKDSIVFNNALTFSKMVRIELKMRRN